MSPGKFFFSCKTGKRKKHLPIRVQTIRRIMSTIKLPSITVSDSATNLLLDAGDYEMTVKEVRLTKVKSGEFAGKNALNIGFATDKNIWVWKQLPMWTLPASAPKNQKDWFRMSTVAFLNAIEHTAAELDTDSLIGKTVVAKVGQQNNGKDYGVQNFIVTFTK
jgi:hypothetical protein